MKTRLRNLFSCTVLIVCFVIDYNVHAQTPGFWGMTNSGGTNDAGVIFKMNPDGTGFTAVKSFTYTTPGAIGDEIGIQLWQSPFGKLYGVTSGGGLNGWGVLFEYDLANGAYVIKHNFIPATGSYPINSLVAGANGKLYGMTSQGGSSNKGVIYEFDYTTGIYTKKIDFTGTNGATPSGGNLYLHSNGKLYGFASFGGSNNLGVLFEYDPSTNTLVKKIDFTGANGKFPYSSLVKASNNKLYSVTLQGGTVDLGILLEYDPATNVLTKRIDFSGSIGTYPASTMVVADNGNLYGTTSAGGASAGGVIFEYNPSTNVYTKKIDATSANGYAAIGSITKASNGKLYGLMYTGGASGYGVLYEYDPSTNTYGNKFDFSFDQPTNFSATGYAPRSTLVQASDGFLYGTTSSGGAGGRGTLFRFNLANSIFNKRIDFNSAPEGKYPYAGLVHASNGKLYGVTNSGGVENEGTIVEINPATGTFSKRQDFTRTLGSYPQGSLVQASNGKLYGLTTIGGTNGDGTIFEFDPASTNTYINKYDFDSNTSGERPIGSLIVAANNKLYGITSQGGANGAGTIFEFDPTTNVFTKKADFDENTTGYGSVGELTQASNGKFYGLNPDGGLNGNGFGVLFEFDLATGTLTPRVSFNGSNGQEPRGSLLQAPNGKLYGMTGYGGANSLGTLFEFDPATNVFTKKIDFNGVTIGSAPTGGLALSSNGKLYGGSSYGGTNDRGVLFEYDPVTNTLTKKIDFNGSDGGDFLFGRLLFVKGAQNITFNALNDKLVNDPAFTLSAASSASLPITYSSSNTSVATVSGTTVTIVGAGTTTITASQMGDANYNAATDVTRTLTVSKLNQSITFNALPTKNFGDPNFSLSATTTSGLSLTYTSSNAAVASVSGNIVTIVGAGTTTITASQAGDANYNAATDVTQTLTVNKLNQTITFDAIPTKNFGDSDFSLSAVTTSGLGITYTSSNTTVATVSGNSVTIVGAGITIITASQPGDASYNAATNISQTLTVNKIDQTITFADITDKTVGDPVFALTASTTSSLPVSFSTSSNKISISGAQVSLLNAGRVTITAVQEGNTNYNAATPVERSFCIKPGQPTITLSNLNSETPTLTSSAATGNQWYRNDVLITGATNTVLTATEEGTYKVRTVVDDCFSVFSDVVVLIVTSLEENSDQISLYPNPTAEWITISLNQLNGSKQISILDGYGRVKENKETDDDEATFNVGSYSNGIYFVKIRMKHSVRILRFLKR